MKCQVFAHTGRMQWFLVEELEVAGFEDDQLDKYSGMDVQLVLELPEETPNQGASGST